jgi:hypothetical protein
MKTSMTRRRRTGLYVVVAAAISAFGRHSNATILYDSYSNGSLPGFNSTSASYAEQVTLAGPANSSYIINGFPDFGITWNDVTQGNQDVFIYLFTGADLSPTATDALASANYVNGFGFGVIPPPSDGASIYSFTGLTQYGVTVPSNTFTVVVQMTDASQADFSTAIGGRFSSGTPAVGSSPGFVWMDTNYDQMYAGSEQVSSLAAGSTGATIRMNIDATLVTNINYQWNSSSGGNWEDSTKWAPTGVPNASDTVNFNLSSNPQTSAGYTVAINNATDACMTFNVMSDRVNLALATTATNTSASELTVSGTLTVALPPSTAIAPTSGFLTLSKTGAGAYGVVQTNAVVVGGTNANGVLGVGTLTVGSGVQLFSNSFLNVSSGSALVVQAGSLVATSSGTIAIAGFINNWTGTVDITNSALDLPSGNLTIVTNQVASGYNLAGGAKWNGTGITSSAAANDSRHLTAVGVIQNNQNGSPLYGSGGSVASTFDNGVYSGYYAPGANDILVKYTYYGDANLDGKVDGSDYSLIDAGYASGGALSGWYNGDFNYDGVIDGSDYALIDNAFNNQSVTSGVSPDISGIEPVTGGDLLSKTGKLILEYPQIATTNAQVAAVPEPAGIAVLVLGAGALFGRAKRRNGSVA